MNTSPENKKFLMYTRKFVRACKNGELEKAKKIFSKNPNIEIDRDIFSNACYNGFFELAKWLLTAKPQVINFINTAFISACRQGHLEIAQWIYSVDASVIEYENNFGLSLACYYGKLNVANWLLPISPNIDYRMDANNKFYDKIFRAACGNQKINVAQWVVNLIPYRYHLEIYEGVITNSYIRDSKDIKWLKRRIPLLAYNLEPYNIFHELNNNLIREICLYV
jgi:hypothetical protein